MRKWFLKNRDIILRNTFIGLLVLVIYYKIFPWLGGIISEFPANKIVNILIDIFEYKLTISIGSFLISTILSVIFISYSIKIYHNFSRRKNKLKILEATYYTDKKSLDITQELTDAIYDDKLKIVLTNEIAGDPDVGTRKKAKIIYKINDEKKEKEYLERDFVDIP